MDAQRGCERAAVEAAPGLITGVLTTGFRDRAVHCLATAAGVGPLRYNESANAFFYFLTGAHAVHIIGGMYVWARATTKVVLGKGDDQRFDAASSCARFTGTSCC